MIYYISFIISYWNWNWTLYKIIKKYLVSESKKMIEKVKIFFNRWNKNYNVIASISKTRQMLSQEKVWAATFINKMNLEIYVPKNKLKAENLKFCIYW